MKRIVTALTLVLTVSLFIAEQISAQKNDSAGVRKAIEKSLPQIEGIRLPFLEKTGCFSCHHNFLPAMAAGLARERGFKVSRQISLEESEQILDLVNAGREKLLQGDGFGGGQFTAALILIGLAANEQPPNKTTDVLVHYLIGRQNADGRWTTPISRPPSESSDITITAVSLRALQLYAPRGLLQEVNTRVQRGRAWLTKAVPKTNEEQTFQLLGLDWSNADKPALRKLALSLSAQQREDGGWGQHPTMGSDAYATGQALVALHQAGGVPVTDHVYQSGVRYLLNSQSENGTWAVKTRTLPLQKYFESGFPYGENQWISAAASSWATMALALTVEAPGNISRSEKR